MMMKKVSSLKIRVLLNILFSVMRSITTHFLGKVRHQKAPDFSEAVSIFNS